LGHFLKQGEVMMPSALQHKHKQTVVGDDSKNHGIIKTQEVIGDTQKQYNEISAQERGPPTHVNSHGHAMHQADHAFSANNNNALASTPRQSAGNNSLAAAATSTASSETEKNTQQRAQLMPQQAGSKSQSLSQTHQPPQSAATTTQGNAAHLDVEKMSSAIESYMDTQFMSQRTEGKVPPPRSETQPPAAAVLTTQVELSRNIVPIPMALPFQHYDSKVRSSSQTEPITESKSTQVISQRANTAQHNYPIAPSSGNKSASAFPAQTNASVTTSMPEAAWANQQSQMLQAGSTASLPATAVAAAASSNLDQAPGSSASARHSLSGTTGEPEIDKESSFQLNKSSTSLSDSNSDGVDSSDDEFYARPPPPKKARISEDPTLAQQQTVQEQEQIVLTTPSLSHKVSPKPESPLIQPVPPRTPQTQSTEPSENLQGHSTSAVVSSEHTRSCCTPLHDEAVVDMTSSTLPESSFTKSQMYNMEEGSLKVYPMPLFTATALSQIPVSFAYSLDNDETYHFAMEQQKQRASAQLQFPHIKGNSGAPGAEVNSKLNDVAALPDLSKGSPCLKTMSVDQHSNPIHQNGDSTESEEKKEVVPGTESNMPENTGKGAIAMSVKYRLASKKDVEEERTRMQMHCDRSAAKFNARAALQEAEQTPTREKERREEAAARRKERRREQRRNGSGGASKPRAAPQPSKNRAPQPSKNRALGQPGNTTLHWEGPAPEPELQGKGNWIKRTYKRHNSTKQFDSYWYSPKLEKRLRSRIEVKRFLGYLEDSTKNPTHCEDVAYTLFRKKA
jgi:hypothetical protein